MESDPFPLKQTEDGSYTFFSAEFGECFHSTYGAAEEAQVIYAKTCELAAKAEASLTNSIPIRILDICYGLGYNSAEALSTIWLINPKCKVELIALELDITVPKQAIAHNLLHSWSAPIPELLRELIDNGKVHTPQLYAQLLLGDARQTLSSVSHSGWKADAIFLDPFSPPKCPQLWSVEFLQLVAQNLAPTGKLATYSSAAAARSALCLAGLSIASITGTARKAPGTVAAFDSNTIPPLSQKEQEHLETRAAVPYRDPLLQDSAEAIRQRRQAEQRISSLASSNQWKKRWFAKTYTS